LSLAMTDAPVDTAAAVWVGIGAVGTAIVAMFLLNEAVNAPRIAGIGLPGASIVTLKFA
jgi:quaternary ammonium compound-resistance protein SugE